MKGKNMKELVGISSMNIKVVFERIIYIPGFPWMVLCLVWAMIGALVVLLLT